MSSLVRNSDKVSITLPRASQVLIDYEYWLKRKHGVTGTYLVNAKSYLKTYRQGGNVQSQLIDTNAQDSLKYSTLSFSMGLNQYRTKMSLNLHIQTMALICFSILSILDSDRTDNTYLT